MKGETSMVRTVRTGPTERIRDLLILWRGRQDSKLPFVDIIREARDRLQLKRRTAINYLNALVEMGILGKEVDSNRNTFYFPKNRLELSKTLLQMQIKELTDEQLKDYLDMFSFFLMIEISDPKQKDLTDLNELQKKFRKAVQEVLVAKHAHEEIMSAARLYEKQNKSILKHII